MKGYNRNSLFYKPKKNKEDTKKSKKKILTIVGLVWVLIMTLLSIRAYAQPTGFEYLDDGDTLHVWNNGTVEPNYYYDNKCLDQVSNQYPRAEAWEFTKKSIKYRDGDQWFIVPMTGCDRTDNTDNLTFVNNTASMQFGSPGHHVDLGMKSSLELNDNSITQEFWGQPNYKIMDDVYFMIKSYNLSVGGDEINDYVIIQNKTSNDTYSYNLSAIREHNISYTLDSSEHYPYYFISDPQSQSTILHEFLNQTQEWELIIDGNVTLIINMEDFARNEYKSFTKKWVDAGCTCGGFNLRMQSESRYLDGTNFTVPTNWSFGCKATLQSFGGGCATCGMEYYTNQYGGGDLINVNANATDVLECHATGFFCIKRIPEYGEWFNQTIECVKEGVVGTWCMHEDNPLFIQNTPSVTTNITCNAPSYNLIELPPEVEMKNNNWIVFLLIGGVGALAFIMRRKKKAYKRKEKE